MLRFWPAEGLTRAGWDVRAAGWDVRAAGCQVSLDLAGNNGSRFFHMVTLSTMAGVPTSITWRRNATRLTEERMLLRGLYRPGRLSHGRFDPHRRSLQPFARGMPAENLPFMGHLR
jgi:hypothetical protein